MIKETLIPKLEIKKQSITLLKVNAIVNPANSFGYMGDGVSEAIKKVGGQEIEDEAIEQAPVQVGDAILTGAGMLLCQKVIHAPTTHNPCERTDTNKISWAVRAALELAEREGFRTIAIPNMGAEAGDVDKHESAETIVKTIREMKFHCLEHIYLVDLSDKMVLAFHKALEKMQKQATT